MSLLRKHVSSVVSGLVGAVVGVSMLGGAAYAANGGSLLLGRANTATATTTLTNSAGTPLSLVAKTGYAPFKVGSKVKVTNLNSDTLDGLDSTVFARATGQFAAVSSAVSVSIDWDNDTVLDSRLSVATCPAGTTVVSGGAEQTSDTPTPAGILASAAEGGNSWYLVTAGTASTPMAQAICYNPRGVVAGGTPVIP